MPLGKRGQQFLTCFEVNMVALFVNVSGLFCEAGWGMYGTDGAHPSEEDRGRVALRRDRLCRS